MLTSTQDTWWASSVPRSSLALQPGPDRQRQARTQVLPSLLIPHCHTNYSLSSPEGLLWLSSKPTGRAEPPVPSGYSGSPPPVLHSCFSLSCNPSAPPPVQPPFCYPVNTWKYGHMTAKDWWQGTWSGLVASPRQRNGSMYSSGNH